MDTAKTTTADAPPLASRKGTVGMAGFLMVVLVCIGMLSALMGMASLSQATEGVGGIALACFFGILARIAQAAHHDSKRDK